MKSVCSLEMENEKRWGRVRIEIWAVVRPQSLSALDHTIPCASIPFTWSDMDAVFILLNCGLKYWEDTGPNAYISFDKVIKLTESIIWSWNDFTIQILYIWSKGTNDALGTWVWGDIVLEVDPGEDAQMSWLIGYVVPSKYTIVLWPFWPWNHAMWEVLVIWRHRWGRETLFALK